MTKAARSLSLIEYPLDRDRQREIEAGFQMHLPTPSHSDRLIQMVRVLTGRASANN